MAADGVAQCFKTTILSSKVRLRKPDPDIYHLACLLHRHAGSQLRLCGR